MALIDPSDPFKPDPSAPDMQQWIKIMGAVEACSANMNDLMKLYGMEVFSVALTIFYENTPTDLVLQVERYRTLAKRLKHGGKSA